MLFTFFRAQFFFNLQIRGKYIDLSRLFNAKHTFTWNPRIKQNIYIFLHLLNITSKVNVFFVNYSICYRLHSVVLLPLKHLVIPTAPYWANSTNRWHLYLSIYLSFLFLSIVIHTCILIFHSLSLFLSTSIASILFVHESKCKSVGNKSFCP